ncbi:MAG: DUF6670 family protein [Acinetobacter sp.]
MQLFPDFLDQSKQLNQTPAQLQHNLPLHAQTRQYKAILLALKIPNLPAPLHYLNFISMIGQPNAAVLRNGGAMRHAAQNTATVMSSISPHMAGQLSRYSVHSDCIFKPGSFQFLDRENFSGAFPEFQLQRLDRELSFHLEIKTAHAPCYFSKLRMGLAEYWSQLCECTGEIGYKGQKYRIQQLGSLEFARAVNFPFLPIAFYTAQTINLSRRRQLIVMQTRDRLNRVLQSRLYLKDFNAAQVQMLDEGVCLKVHRVYPAVTTPDQRKMYLPREFEWTAASGAALIRIQAQSRGDFKFGVGAGYAGSFSYQVKIGDAEESGESGYCEYIDCRPLNWQEKNKKQKLLDGLADSVPVLLKK